MEQSIAAKVLLARQPIFGRDLELVAYELLFRRDGDTSATIADADQATATVVTNAFVELGLASVVGTTPAWLNISHSYLSDRLALILPNDRVALEILEPHTAEAGVLAALDELRGLGYRLVLDDFVFDPSLRALVELADVIKLDVRALSEEELGRQVRMLRRFRVELVAEKVETRDEFLRCFELGFDAFQGYFFCKPEAVKGKVMAPNRIALLELIARVQDPDVDLAELEALLARDVSLSYRLLRYVNSAYLGLPSDIDSISRAVMMLGLNDVKRWATMTMLSTIDDKPEQLVVTALVRGRLCETLGAALGHPRPDELFTLGMFSVIDGLLDAPMDVVLSSVPFSERMRRALVTHEGDLGELLASVIAWERGDAAASADVASREKLAGLYFEALEWADTVAAGLGSSSGATAAAA